MSTCDKKGHYFVATTRQVSTYYGLTTTTETFLYCRRCGAQRQTQYHGWPLNTPPINLTNTTGWTYLYLDKKV